MQDLNKSRQTHKKPTVRPVIRWVLFGVFSLLVVSLGKLYFDVIEARKEIAHTGTMTLDFAQESSAVEEYFLTDTQLAEYNGIDADKPILIAIDGVLYDVSEGARFYGEGEVYHFLAGTDATQALEWVGTGIITEKYPSVGRLIE